MAASPRERSAWAGANALAWGAAVLAVLLMIAPTWAPSAHGAWSAGSVRNVAPTLQWSSATTMRAFDANGEEDLFALVVEVPGSAPIELSFAIPFQAFTIGGRDVTLTIAPDARAHDGLLLLQWAFPHGAPTASAQVHAVDRAGAPSASVPLAQPARPHASATMRGVDGPWS